VPDLNEIFKAYDIRGVFPTQLDENTTARVGRAIVCFLNAKKVVVGRDMRKSSEKLFRALVDGITSQGADVIDIGLASTDLFYFSTWKLGANAGVIITASHNPPEYNGLKIVKEKSHPVGEDTGLKEIRALVEKGRFTVCEKRGSVEQKDMLGEFAEFCLGFVDKSKIKPLKVVMDAGNGMASVVAPAVFKKLPIKQVRQCFSLDGSFPNHLADPLQPQNRVDTEKRVKKEGADLGLMWDGDADRCFFVNERGEFVAGDLIVALIAKNMLKKNKGRKVLYDVRCSHFVPKTIRAAGGIPVLQRVGHAFFKQSMREENALFGGELSGHNYYAVGDFFADNGLIPALQIMELISEENKGLSELLAEAKGFCHSGEINSRVEDKDAKLLEIEEKYRGKAKKVFHIDGLSMEFHNYWFNVRKSNTEPLLRLVLEAGNRELMEEKVKELLALIRK
jgi:phosphomannomutase